IELPVSPQQVPIPVPQMKRWESHAGQPLRILIIDDQRDASYPMRKLLERDGHQVEVAIDGPSGLDSARRLLPQVIICDIGLPGGMNGYEVAQELRADP